MINAPISLITSESYCYEHSPRPRILRRTICFMLRNIKVSWRKELLILLSHFSSCEEVSLLRLSEILSLEILSASISSDTSTWQTSRNICKAINICVKSWIGTKNHYTFVTTNKPTTTCKYFEVWLNYFWSSCLLKQDSRSQDILVSQRCLLNSPDTVVMKMSKKGRNDNQWLTHGD